MATTEERTLIRNIVEFLTHCLGDIAFVVAGSELEARETVCYGLSRENISQRPVDLLGLGEDPVSGFENALVERGFVTGDVLIIFCQEQSALADLAVDLYERFNREMHSPRPAVDRKELLPGPEEVLILGISMEAMGLNLELRPISSFALEGQDTDGPPYGDVRLY